MGDLQARSVAKDGARGAAKTVPAVPLHFDGKSLFIDGARAAADPVAAIVGAGEQGGQAWAYSETQGLYHPGQVAESRRGTPGLLRAQKRRDPCAATGAASFRTGTCARPG